ncbi:hypothetical protein LR48_Vigan03g287000 [Vigna angularis]|uniref:SANT domain-containing protein n=2 Tax=Phaseolus angularis TaxID=3914 RepID=A0A0L9U9S8_PHAAN|nr:uncharacterized protein LOC108329239 [Vigna angularis]KAG2406602.1 uncharacterized protein HKW66_Vig0058580 [Vigna angularis]KOM39488.1 hypothetical protein LR48_Vigan03g287000 [Vigna angularis]BAT86332.1 hypothetical protein VIGAN_04397100 [Vigna angularis var. angularis]
MDSRCFDDYKEDGEGRYAEGFEDKFGDPEVQPRVGEEYQAEIPPLISAPYRSLLVKKTRDSEITVNLQECISLGLPIPLKWGHCEFESSSGYGSLGSIRSEVGPAISENECSETKVELYAASRGEEIHIGGFSNFEPSSKSAEKDKMRGKYLLPGLLDDQSWTNTEYSSFLLGLYVFGKKLNFLKRFVGSKSMGDILSLYYGKFFKSKEYCRWAECRKLRTKRCIYGRKIFTGWRQQELLSRLFSYLPRECHTRLLEISRNFGEGKMPFEEYVFSLKDAVGIDLLIAAVGIGKGKQDLTGTAVEPTKTNHIFSVRPEIPIGKACSSLTSADIIKFLTGDFRLSKARSSDLFWEAVWPRLLAKGWHSEQPKDVSGSKQSLVFLVPDIKKFSRRKLVKGNHYFDSISDVLNKVASDPGLLETESQATECSVDREKTPDKRDLEGVSCGEQAQYLQSHRSKCNQDVRKFTIVDTSMVHDMNQRNVIQMRSLPSETTNISTISSCSSESEKDTSYESKDQVRQYRALNAIKGHVEQDNASSAIENQVEKSHVSSSIDEWVEQAHASSHIEDRVEQAHALSPIKDRVEQAHASSLIDDRVEQAHASSLIDDRVEQAHASGPIKDRIEQAHASSSVEDQFKQANSFYPIQGQVEQGNSSNPIEEFSYKGLCIDSSNCTCVPEALSINKDGKYHRFHSDLHNGEHLREINEHSHTQKMTTDCTIPCITAMQKLRACNHQENSHCTKSTSVDRNFDLNEPISPSNLQEASEDMVFSMGSGNLSLPNYLAKGSPSNISHEGSVSENRLVREESAENSETRMLIDLNFPQVAPDLGLEMEIPSSGVTVQNDNQFANASSSPSEITQFNATQEFPDGNNEQQSILVNRRQSTRNRPLTTKALEALEYRFINSKRKRKNTECSDNNPKSKCVRVSSDTIVSGTCDDGIEDSMVDTRAEEENIIQAYSYGIDLNRGPP